MYTVHISPDPWGCLCLWASINFARKWQNARSGEVKSFLWQFVVVICGAIFKHSLLVVVAAIKSVADSSYPSSPLMAKILPTFRFRMAKTRGKKHEKLTHPIRRIIASRCA